MKADENIRWRCPDVQTVWNRQFFALYVCWCTEHFEAQGYY